MNWARCLSAVLLGVSVMLWPQVAGAEQKKASDVRIVFVTHGEASDTYWSVVKNGMSDAQKLMGTQVEYMAPDVWDVVKMGKLMDAAIASKPDGLVVTIPDMQAIGSKVKKATDAGILHRAGLVLRYRKAVCGEAPHRRRDLRGVYKS